MRERGERERVAVAKGERGERESPLLSLAKGERERDERERERESHHCRHCCKRRERCFVVG